MKEDYSESWEKKKRLSKQDNYFINGAIIITTTIIAIGLILMFLMGITAGV